MTWSVPIWFDLWLASMAGGAYSTAFLVSHFGGGGNKPLLRLATYLGVPLVVTGVLLLVIDLGNPLRFWHFLTQFKLLSPMSMGTWILLAWVVIAVTIVILWRVENHSSKETADRVRGVAGFLSLVNLAFAVLLMVYSGVLPAVSSKALWTGTVLLPALFVASAISMGLAILIIAALTVDATRKGSFVLLKPAISQVFGSTDWTIPNQMVVRLAKANAIVILIELAALIGHLIGLAASARAGASEAFGLLISGTLAIPFWLGVVLLALLIPLALYAINWGKDVETGNVGRVIAISSVCVISGGLLLRAVITVGGQI